MKSLMKKKPKINLREQQLERLKEIGAHLRQIRTEKGLSIEEIAVRTCIQSRLLRAIEEGQLGSLPEPIYIRGFIKQFADVLHLDGGELASKFPTDLGFSGNKSRFGGKLPGIQLRPIHLYFLYIGLVIASVQGISHQMQQIALQSAIDPVSKGIESNSIKEKSIAKPALASLPSPTPENGEQPVVVDIKVQDQCWLRVVVDGKTEFEGVLPQGTHRTWQANQELTVRAGNAGGVLVAVNNEVAKQLGPPGKVQEVTYQVKSRS